MDPFLRLNFFNRIAFVSFKFFISLSYFDFKWCKNQIKNEGCNSITRISLFLNSHHECSVCEMQNLKFWIIATLNCRSIYSIDYLINYIFWARKEFTHDNNVGNVITPKLNYKFCWWNCNGENAFYIRYFNCTSLLFSQ